MTEHLTPEQQRIYDRNTYTGPLPQAKAAEPKQPATKAPSKPGVRSTSREAYFREVKPHLNDKQRQVYVAFQMAGKPICNQELAEYLQRPINQITPRVFELMEMGKVQEAKRDIYLKTGRRVIYREVVR